MGPLPEESTPKESLVEYNGFEADSTALQSPVTIGRHWRSEEDSSGNEPVPVPRSHDTTPDGNGQQPPAKYIEVSLALKGWVTKDLSG